MSGISRRISLVVSGETRGLALATGDGGAAVTWRIARARSDGSADSHSGSSWARDSFRSPPDRQTQKTGVALVQVERADAVRRRGVRIGAGIRDVPNHMDFSFIGALKFGQQVIHPSGKRLECFRCAARGENRIKPDFHRRIQMAHQFDGLAGKFRTGAGAACCHIQTRHRPGQRPEGKRPTTEPVWHGPTRGRLDREYLDCSRRIGFIQCGPFYFHSSGFFRPVNFRKFRAAGGCCSRRRRQPGLGNIWQK